jgi:hypothetical protein
LNQDQSSIQFGNCTLAKSTRKVQRKKKKKIRSNRKIARLEIEGRKSGKSSNLTTQK